MQKTDLGVDSGLWKNRLVSNQRFDKFINFKDVIEINNSIAAFPFFVLPDARLLVCIEPGHSQEFVSRDTYIHHTSSADLSCEQWIQQLYG